MLRKFFHPASYTFLLFLFLIKSGPGYKNVRVERAFFASLRDCSVLNRTFFLVSREGQRGRLFQVTHGENCYSEALFSSMITSPAQSNYNENATNHH